MSKSKEKLQLELEHRRVTQITGAIVAVVRDLIKWGTIAFVCYCGYLSVRDVSLSLAGKITQADINVSIFQGVAVHLMQNAKLHERVEYVLIISFFLWGLFERRLRGSVVERLTVRIHQLELQLDPKRTSSRLTSRGQTRPGDEP